MQGGARLGVKGTLIAVCLLGGGLSVAPLGLKQSLIQALAARADSRCLRRARVQRLCGSITNAQLCSRASFLASTEDVGTERF